MNGDSKSTQEWVPSMVGSVGLLCRCKRFLFCLDCSSQPSTKYFFPYHTLFQFLCSPWPASWAGSRAESPVSQYVSLVVSQTWYSQRHLILLDVGGGGGGGRGRKTLFITVFYYDTSGGGVRRWLELVSTREIETNR